MRRGRAQEHRAYKSKDWWREVGEGGLKLTYRSVGEFGYGTLGKKGTEPFGRRACRQAKRVRGGGREDGTGEHAKRDRKEEMQRERKGG